MRVVTKVLAYALFVVVGGALLAPPLYWLGQWAVDSDSIPQLARFRFPKYLNRAVLIAALAGLWPFLRSLGLHSWEMLGIRHNADRWKDLVTGIVVGVGGLWTAATLMVWAGHFQMKGTIRVDLILSALATAVAVSLIEEVFFRGALLGALRRSLPWHRALGFLTVFFAAVHFLKPHPSLKRFSDPVTWSTGFEILPMSFWQYTQPELLVGGFVTLLLVGWTLGYTVIKTQSLALAIGLHGGWVFALKLFTFSSKRVGEPGWLFGRDLITGLVPAALLGITLAGLHMWLKRRSAHCHQAMEPMIIGEQEDRSSAESVSQ